MADTAILTLTEFLLARIAEDEATFSDTGWTDRRWLGRLRAECEAKRRIVESHLYLQGTLKILAAVYADHPDYREQWRA